MSNDAFDEAGFASGDEFEDDDGDWGDVDAMNDDMDVGAVSAAVLVESLPRALRERIQRDVEEVRMVAPFVASTINFGGGTRVTLRIGLPVSALGLNVEQARAWSLSNDQFLLAELKCPAFYFRSTNHAQIKVTVGQFPTLSMPTDTSELDPMKLSWPLWNKLQNRLIPELPSLVDEPDWSIEDAQLIKETCDCSWLQAIRALIEYKCPHQAIEAISNDHAQHTGPQPAVIVNEQKQSQSCTPSIISKFAKIFHKNRETSSMRAKPSVPPAQRAARPAKHAKAVASSRPTKYEDYVIELCHVDIATARRALHQCKSPEAAVEFLLDDPEAARQTLSAIDDPFDQMNPYDYQAESDVLPPSQPMLITEPSSSFSFASSSANDAESEALVALLTPHNFLIRILLAMMMKIKTVSATCLMCESPLPHSGLNLSICSKQLCVTSYESFGVGFSLPTVIRTSPLLIDLYISMLVAAASSEHLPFAKPMHVSALDKDGKEHKLVKNDESKSVDFIRLQACINKIPAIKTLTDWIDAKTFVEQCNKLDVLILPLLRWLCQSNPSYLRELAPEERFESIATPHQFVLLMSSPEREVEFQRKKAACPSGAKYAWHGSPSRNWHSIMRTGLKNLSGTDLQLHGAVYGKGIYLAADSATSLSYSQGWNRSSVGWKHSAFSSSILFLALCEVVANAGTFNPYLVVDDETLVTTRYLFVLPLDSTARSITKVEATEIVNEMKPSIVNFDPALLQHRYADSK